MKGKSKKPDLAGDLVVDGEMYGCVKSFCYLGYTLDGMVDRILLLQLESEWMKRAFAISDIQSTPARYERSSVCQL